MYRGCLWGGVQGGCVSIGNKSPHIPRMRTVSQVCLTVNTAASAAHTGHEDIVSLQTTVQLRDEKIRHPAFKTNKNKIRLYSRYCTNSIANWRKKMK